MSEDISFARLYSAQPHELRGIVVTVEVDVTRGMHAFTIVGLPDKAVEEARDRVGTALKNSGFESPKHANQKTTVSLVPAELRKEGSYYDVSIALGYLVASGIIDFDRTGKVFIGELSLNGDIQPLRGVLPIVVAAVAAGYTEIYVPAINAAEAALVDGIDVYPITTLVELVHHLDPKGYETVAQKKIDLKLSVISLQSPTTISNTISKTAIDFADVRGQFAAKRGLEIAAVGGHNVALFGPPGTGKTMLARAFVGILPGLSRSQVLEITGIHSVAGTLEDIAITTPPFRSPHHTASYVSVVGGGANLKPGEVTLAHHGVLFLDEFPEFDKRVIESLRQPLEDRYVTISRAKGTAKFPAQFTLVAALNPCPCGYAGSTVRPCVCTRHHVTRYQRKISGPIVDRIDVWLPVEHVEYQELHQSVSERESSSNIRERVLSAREFGINRAQTSGVMFPNHLISARDMEHILLADTAKEILLHSAKKLKLSPRAYHRVIRLARTIADIAHSQNVEEDHILEALQYRPKV